MPERSRALLRAARDAVAAAVGARAPEIGALERSPALMALGAAFVTLRSPDGTLRGCIGELEPHKPLIDSVRHCAAGAALRDPRFSPVSVDEVSGLRIGLSVLGPSRAISHLSEIETGRHGLIVENGERRGVLLPEVAVDLGWDAARFLAATCEKAGLTGDAWRDPGTRVSVFETEKLNEP